MLSRKEISTLIHCIKYTENEAAVDPVTEFVNDDALYLMYEKLIGKIGGLTCDEQGDLDDEALWANIARRAPLFDDHIESARSGAFTTTDCDMFLVKDEETCEILANFFSDIMPSFTFQTGQYEEGDFDEDDKRIGMYYLTYE